MSEAVLQTGAHPPAGPFAAPSVAQAAHRRHIEALQRRALQHQGPARALIDARLQHLHAAQDMPAPPVGTSPAHTSPLALLLAHVNGTGELATHHPLPANLTPGPVQTPQPVRSRELKAISQYRNTWSRLSAEQRLHQALAQVPSNAGPLNTQRLLHEALAAMRDASSQYLHHFMVQVETLLWLEQLGPSAAPVADKKPAARKARA